MEAQLTGWNGGETARANSRDGESVGQDSILLQNCAELDELYRFTIRINRQIPFIADEHGAVISIAPLWGEWCGARLSDAMGYKFLSRIHPEDRGGLADAWANATRGAEAYVYDHRTRMADGSYRWFRCAAEKYHPEDGTAPRWRGLLSDIDELFRARAAAQASEARFRTAALATRDVIWEVDLQTRLVTFGDLITSFLGYDVEEITSSASWWREKIHPDDIARTSASFCACPAGERWVCDFRLRRVDGDYVHMQSRAFIARDATGRAIRVTGALADLTEERATRQRIERLQLEMVDSSRLGAAAALSAMLSHELNQPLTSLANFIRGARRLLHQGNPASHDSILMAMDAAATSALEAGTIVHRMSELVSQGEGRLSAQNLWEAANDARSLTCLDTAWNNVDIAIAPELHDFDVIGDRIQMRQVFLNIFRNAVDALRATREPMIRVTVTAAQEFVEVTIADNGPGFCGSKPEGLFAPFVTTKPNGVGLGLSICQMIIESLGGGIRAQQNPEGGATFLFTMPRVEPEPQNPQTAAG